MVKRITVTPCCFYPDCIMEIDVPDNEDAEEYIDGFLEAIIDSEFRYNVEWDFI